ncbi:hypothetical protein NHQ30_001616 [Ciborinia camelliae]|nr:hypothetical protein NHQ30_001616 [Ciborinia camelliae]
MGASLVDARVEQRQIAEMNNGNELDSGSFVIDDSSELKVRCRMSMSLVFDTIRFGDGDGGFRLGGPEEIMRKKEGTQAVDNWGHFSALALDDYHPHNPEQNDPEPKRTSRFDRRSRSLAARKQLSIYQLDNDLEERTNTYLIGFTNAMDDALLVARLQKPQRKKWPRRCRKVASVIATSEHGYIAFDSSEIRPSPHHVFSQPLAIVAYQKISRGDSKSSTTRERQGEKCPGVTRVTSAYGNSMVYQQSDKRTMLKKKGSSSRDNHLVEGMIT